MTSRTAVFLLLVLGFFASLFAIERIAYQFSQLLPENYRYTAWQAARDGEYGRAEVILQRRITRFAYDFEAHYQLAEVMARQRNFAGAADVMRTVLAKVPAARSNRVMSVGYDEPRTLYLLARYLWGAGNFRDAAEMACAALDAGHPMMNDEVKTRLEVDPDSSGEALAIARVALKLKQDEPYGKALAVLESKPDSRAQACVMTAKWLESVQKNRVGADTVLRAALSVSPDKPLLLLELANLLGRSGGSHGEQESLLARARGGTGTRGIGPGLFELPVGAAATTSTVSLGQSGIAKARVNTGAYRVTNLSVNLRGSRAMGLFPIVIVRAGGREMARLYPDGLQPMQYDLALWPDGAPKSLDLEFEFANDAYDPFTKADRNVSISNVLLH
jgi:tetratricopeptide (TPR) repeat protein